MANGNSLEYCHVDAKVYTLRLVQGKDINSRYLLIYNLFMGFYEGGILIDDR